MTNMRDVIDKFLASQMLGVVSSVSPEGTPQSALVAFSETPDGKLIFGTFEDTRKYRNIMKNPRVAFTVHEGDIAVQIEGHATEATGSDLDQCRTIHGAKNPGSRKYIEDLRQRFFIITPSWMRYTDYQTEPDTVWEQPL